MAGPQFVSTGRKSSGVLSWAQRLGSLLIALCVGCDGIDAVRESRDAGLADAATVGGSEETSTSTNADDDSPADEPSIAELCAGEEIEVRVEADGTTVFSCGELTIRVEPQQASAPTDGRDDDETESPNDDDSDHDDSDHDDSDDDNSQPSTQDDTNDDPPGEDDSADDDNDTGDDDTADDDTADDDSADDSDDNDDLATDDDSADDSDDTDDLATDDDASDDGADSGAPPVLDFGDELCRPLNVIEKLPARASVTSSSASTPAPTPVYVRDVFDRFRSVCGACHVDASLGNFKVTESTFTNLVTRREIEFINRNDADVMPPGVAFNTRPEQDPVRELYALLNTWRNAVEPIINAGNPAPSVFFIDAAPSDGSSPYLLTPELGAAMSNLGTCLPSPEIIATEVTRSAELDALFEQAQGLPKTLRETDLITLESQELARHGVISYAPTYPLFSDDAGKMRYVRVPRGQTIVFDHASQEFDIPPNTRFYKTFLKEVKDADGNVGRWRKIETRLIVSRPDSVLADGTREPNALFGTYQWDENETKATLVEDPLRNGEPFRDRLFSYLTDEVAGKALLDNPPVVGLERQMAEDGLGRYYGIPGSQRCVGCHRGSAQHSFILGFGPLQVNRLPTGEQGVYDPASPDELTQLQRLMEYGLITGIDDPHDEQEVFPLELTQDVLPRTPQELNVQAYMVGNCGFCHNSDGLATYENPVLDGVLDFWPDQNGGIFGFPLTGDAAFSPRIRRGPEGKFRIPYVSPAMNERAVPRSYVKDSNADGTPDEDLPLLAPWRSLIYRNADTPFTYEHDEALFPKMPMHVPGYDIRAPRLIGEWMASLPARQIDGDANNNSEEEQPFEEVFPNDDDWAAAVTEASERLSSYRTGGRYDCKPFTECLTGSCSNPCVDTRDIVAHEVLEAIRQGGRQLTPLLSDLSNNDDIPDRPHWVNTDLTAPPLDQWEPRRPDWPAVLLCGNHRQDPGEDCDLGPAGGETCTRTCKSITCSSETLTAEQIAECERSLTSSADEALAVEVLRDGNVKLTEDFWTLAMGERPMAFWQEKENCDLSEFPTGGNYSGPVAANWLDEIPTAEIDRPLYFQAPGEAIFTNICANCHGPLADSQGRQAVSVSLLSGGETRVANLRDGLMGSGSIQAQFGPYASADTRPIDLAARYVGWMALGGTQRTIPDPILRLVRSTRVYGHTRRLKNEALATPNMLELAVTLCGQLVNHEPLSSRLPFLIERGSIDFGGVGPEANTSMIGLTGDAEMWRDLCTYDNPSPVLVLREREGTNDNWESPAAQFIVAATVQRQTRDGRPLYAVSQQNDDGSLSWFDTPVGNHEGESVARLDATNKTPWCVAAVNKSNEPLTEAQLANANTFAADWESRHTGSFPWCPPDVLTRTPGSPTVFHYRSTTQALQRWSRRGATNAGLAVLAYLDAVKNGLLPKPPYNQCDAR